MNSTVIKTFVFFLSIAAGLICLAGCSYMPGPLSGHMNTPMDLLPTSVSLRTLEIERENLYPREDALAYVANRLNALQHGVALNHVSSPIKKTFGFNEIYLKLYEKVSKRIGKKEVLFLVELSNVCEDSGTTPSAQVYSKNFFYVSELNARTACSALYTLGALICGDPENRQADSNITPPTQPSPVDTTLPEAENVPDDMLPESTTDNSTMGQPDNETAPAPLNPEFGSTLQ